MQEAAVRAVQNAMGSTALPGVLSMVPGGLCCIYQDARQVMVTIHECNKSCLHEFNTASECSIWHMAGELT